MFPSDQQRQVRLQVAHVIESVVSQILLHSIEEGRVAAFEIMLGNYAIGSLIREARIHEISGILEVSSQQGMHTLDQGLEQLVKEGLITMEVALMSANRPDILRGKLMAAMKARGQKGGTHPDKQKEKILSKRAPLEAPFLFKDFSL